MNETTTCARRASCGLDLASARSWKHEGEDVERAADGRPTRERETRPTRVATRARDVTRRSDDSRRGQRGRDDGGLRGES